MTQDKQRYPRGEANEVAEALMKRLADSCERIVIAGSLRRGLDTVGDIELLCISKLGANLAVPKPPAQQGAFAFKEDDTDETLPFAGKFDPALRALDVTIHNLIEYGRLAKRLSKNGRFTYGPQNKLLIHTESGIPVDIFTVPQENWGMALVVRTGSANFNKRLMKAFIDRDMDGHAYGGVTVPGRGEVQCPTEQSVFDLLGWEFIEPADRER